VSPIVGAAVALAAYLLGSLPFSYWVAQRRGVDVRSVGSGNVGATNVLRAAGPNAAVIALVLDAFKGAAASLLGASLDSSGRLAALAAGAVVVGHVFSVWLRFRGGKGVATGFGALVPLAPLAALIALGVFGVVLAATRFVSLGSIVAALTLAALAPLLGAPTFTSLVVAGVAALIVVRHHANLVRLWRGTESRLGRAAAEVKGSGS
jgi:glycerol-3-phosphate acyltransferase PlsY